MDAVRVKDPTRTRTEALEPADFADIGPCVGVDWDAGVLVVEFSATLTAEQRQLVQLRCITADDREEQILRQSRQAYQSNLDYLAKASPTTAEAVAQVAALTRQINGVLRHLLRT